MFSWVKSKSKNRFSTRTKTNYIVAGQIESTDVVSMSNSIDIAAAVDKTTADGSLQQGEKHARGYESDGDTTQTNSPPPPPPNPFSPPSDFTIEQTKSLALLQQTFPSELTSSLEVFANAKPLLKPFTANDIIASYNLHLKWRETFPLNLTPTISFSPPDPNFPREWVSEGGLTTDCCTTILFTLGASFSAKAPAQLYIDRCCHILDNLIHAGRGVRKVALFVDCRGHAGLENLPAVKMIPLFRGMAGVLKDNYPEVCQYIVLYSISPVINFGINIIKKCLDKDVRKKFKVLSGDGKATPVELKGFVGGVEMLPRWAWRFHRDLWPEDERERE